MYLPITVFFPSKALDVLWNSAVFKQVSGNSGSVVDEELIVIVSNALRLAVCTVIRIRNDYYLFVWIGGLWWFGTF